ncbi:MAG: hypothetical protein BXU00_01980 [Candidatus Nanoclepta minutus]|uniref:2-(3-amino-3-carboxypropyl)histidine synthase n=1 Tax=Candidatus Nanoclepta minutus TaxID=1940235 RepID=A0A397WMJ4_9ARCH|nr:MAG: hypothetical protein BXU00_01980 [Candidatus Nanoclepta minutus]
MEVVFIPTRYKVSELKNFNELIEKIPKEVGMVCLAQYIDFFTKIKNKLEEIGFKVYTKPPYYVLGCNVEPSNLPVDTILLIGNGKFHALEIVRKYDKKVIVYDPISGLIDKYEEYNKRIIFYLLEELKSSYNVGIILSIKPGQYYYNRLKNLLEKLRDKNIYLFIGDKIDLDNLRNYPYIDFWIINACPRIMDDILENRIKALTADIILGG